MNGLRGYLVYFVDGLLQTGRCAVGKERHDDLALQIPAFEKRADRHRRQSQEKVKTDPFHHTYFIPVVPPMQIYSNKNVRSLSELRIEV